eukprot:CAMPEP_0167814126 /NCGR_PEP_ID=MMETSP0112_2-20121227/2242_1 /TAXON_ID=91324 /ORGANISM="Lotharella globosa, Strain CCCM811" /LENGTH=35 /DNA_ID= /DNA_START= /DNA_END= /DNA_ORIENTATION=
MTSAARFMPGDFCRKYNLTLLNGIDLGPEKEIKWE